MLQVVALAALLPLGGTLDKVEQARAAGQYQQAVAFLTDLSAQSPDLFKANNLLYLQAVLEEQAGKDDAASLHYQEVLRSNFPLPDNVLLHLISSSGKSELSERKERFEAFLSRFPTHPRWSAIAIELADLLAENKRDQEAITWYRRIIAQGGLLARPSRLRLAKLLLKPASAKAASRKEALSLLNKVIAENTADSAALEAATAARRVETLAQLSERELYRRALVFTNQRKTLWAKQYLNRLTGPRFRSSGDQAEYRYLVGRNLSLARNSRAAIQSYEQTYRLFPNAEWGVYSELQAGNLQLTLKNYEAAARAFRTVVQNNATSSHFERAVVGLSDARLGMGDRQGGAQVLRDALRRPEANGASLLVYRLAMLRIEDGDYREASENLSLISGLSAQQLPVGVTREEVLFWRAFCFERLELRDEAVRSFTDTVLGRPNYFAFLARDRLAKADVEAMLQSATAARKPWVAPQRLIMARPPAPAEASTAAPITTTAVGRVQELLFLRLYDEAYVELKRQKPGVSFADEADYLYQLAILAERGGLYAQSLDAAQQLEDRVFGRNAPDYYPAELKRLLYPLRYWEFAKAYGAIHDIDPFLIEALIRQESSFQADAISRASARGLMQIMPATGRQLARKLKVRYPGNYILNDPETSIRLGAYYFRQMLDSFNGNAEKALAAYNGGASNVKRWQESMVSDEPALFVSKIGFRETKLYVQRVLGYYRTYKQLYGEEELSAK